MSQRGMGRFLDFVARLAMVASGAPAGQDALMTLTFSNTPGVHAPAPSYQHVAVVTGPGRRLVMSGQVGTKPDGSSAGDGPAQIEQAFANVLAHLAANGMGPKDIVKMTVFLTDAALIPALRAVRTRVMQGAAPTSTLLIVAGLAAPEFKVEVECEAFSVG
jgi:enamine deaminase RidA (YjgF/YER057c/UK114 family)